MYDDEPEFVPCETETIPRSFYYDSYLEYRGWRMSKWFWIFLMEYGFSEDIPWKVEVREMEERHITIDIRGKEVCFFPHRRPSVDDLSIDRRRGRGRKARILGETRRPSGFVRIGNARRVALRVGELERGEREKKRKEDVF